MTLLPLALLLAACWLLDALWQRVVGTPVVPKGDAMACDGGTEKGLT